LSDRLLTKPPKKDHLLGLIPHYVDKASEWIHQFMSNHPKQVLLIDVERPAKQVIEDIGRCRMIASSSLHGIIVADAFHIPNVWLEISTDVAGGGFKFYDYNSSIRADQKAIRCRDLKDIASIGRLAVLSNGVRLLHRYANNNGLSWAS
jgi:pyruvyltransferase